MEFAKFISCCLLRAEGTQKWGSGREYIILSILLIVLATQLEMRGQHPKQKRMK